MSNPQGPAASGPQGPAGAPGPAVPAGEPGVVPPHPRTDGPQQVPATRPDGPRDARDRPGTTGHATVGTAPGTEQVADPSGAGTPAADAAPPDGPDPAAPPVAADPVDGRRRMLRIAAAVAAVVVLAAGAFGFAGRGQVYDGVRTVAALAPDTDAVLDADEQAGDRNVLVLGVQADRAGAPESARTDTAVVVHQPAGDAPAVTLSIPATLEVPRPPCARWDAATGGYGQTVPAESRTAFATAYDIGGPACAVGVVQQLTGIPLTGFVAFDLAGTPDLVDGVGGIEVCTERPVVDPVLGPVVEGTGTVALDGPSAVRFASATGTGDSSPANRVQRQQRVLAAALGDALSTSSLLTPGAPGRAADGAGAALVADGVDAGEILTLAGTLGRAGTAGDGSTPVFLPVPVSDAPNTRGHLELQRGDARELFSALRAHEPLPESATAPEARAAAAPAPGTRVDLVDATGRPGAVDEIAADLRSRGYEIGDVRTGPPTDRAVVRYSPDNTDAAGALVGGLPGARPAPDPAGSGTLELVVGAAGQAPVQAVPVSDTDCS